VIRNAPAAEAALRAYAGSKTRLGGYYMKMKTRLLTMLLALCTLLSLCCGAFAAGLDNFKPVNEFVPGQFTDLPETHWAYNNIKTAYEFGLMMGNSDTVFGTDGGLTVAATITLAARIHSIYNTGSESFVQGSPWYQCYVDYAKENGIITKSYKNYDALIQRWEFAQIMGRSVPESELAVVNSIEDGSIPDVNPSESYAADVYSLYRAGILTGKDDHGSFKPTDGILRSESATIITRIVVPSLRVSYSLSRDKLIEAVMASESQWYRKTESGTVTEFYFMDFTLDKVPEFVVSVAGGTGLFTNYYVYRYQDGQMVQIMKEEWIEKSAPDTFTLCRSKSDGSLFYIGEDTLRMGHGYYEETTHKFDGTTQTFLFGSGHAGDSITYYNGSSQKITKSAYNNLYNSLWNGVNKLALPKSESLTKWNRSASDTTKYMTLAQMLYSVYMDY